MRYFGKSGQHLVTLTARTRAPTTAGVAAHGYCREMAAVAKCSACKAVSAEERERQLDAVRSLRLAVPVK